jgi:hypothetical protein
MMTDQELIEAFYADIKQPHDNNNWVDRLFKFPDHRATYGEFFDVLPEPLRSYARAEIQTGRELEDTVTLRNLFDYAFTWAESEHGKIWCGLWHDVDRLLDDKEVTVPTIEELLKLNGPT